MDGLDAAGWSEWSEWMSIPPMRFNQEASTIDHKGFKFMQKFGSFKSLCYKTYILTICKKLFEQRDCLGPSFEDCKSQFCHSEAKNVVAQEITSCKRMCADLS